MSECIVCVCACMYICVCICMYVCAHSTHLDECLCVSACVCVCICSTWQDRISYKTHTYMTAYIHAYIHTNKLVSADDRMGLAISIVLHEHNPNNKRQTSSFIYGTFKDMSYFTHEKISQKKGSLDPNVMNSFWR